MRQEDNIRQLQKKCSYLSGQLEEAVKELARFDLLDLTLTQQKRQTIATFNFIKVMQEKIQKALTIEDLYSNIVKALTSELFMDSAALIKVDLKKRNITALASLGLPDKIRKINLYENSLKEELLTPTFLNGNSSTKPFHRFIRKSFEVPYFIWYPIQNGENEGLVLFVGNNYEDPFEKQPFSEMTLETFGAIASVIALRTENIIKTHEILTTEQKEAEKALRNSEQKYHLLVEHANQGILVAQDGMIKFLNPKILEISGYLYEELSSKPFREFIHPDDREMVNKNHIKRLSGEHVPYIYVFRIIDKDGNIKWLEINATLITWDGSIAVLGFLSDITERVQMEKALQYREEYLRALIENALDVIFILDANGKFIFSTPSIEEIMGYKPEELLGQEGYKFIYKDDLQKFMADLKEPFHKPGSIKKIEVRIRHRDGFLRTIEGTWRNFLNNPAVQGIIINVHDITERKRTEEKMEVLQEQLRQSQKIEAVGQLAGGVAHDFNNLLTIIQGYTDLSLLTLREGDPIRENIELIKKAVKRAAELTYKLLAFSRRQIMEMKVTNLNDLIKELDKMLPRVISEDIELITILSDNLGLVSIDPGQIEQAILNLVVNARDAMPSGGKLIIETSNVELDDTYAKNHMAVKTGRYVMLSLSDTGIGMDKETKERVFEPFFTTKGKDKGTGLGLSTVYGIVKQSGGNIWVYSEPEKGTTFKIYLPMVKEPVEEDEIKEKATGEEILRGDETILIVEDEEEVRKLAAGILRKQGYSVLEAPQGGDALLICEQHKNPIHMIITDVVMPRMSGPELVTRLESLRSKMKVLYMSGYTDNAIVHHGILEEGINYIQKPFTVDKFAKKVREVLDE